MMDSNQSGRKISRMTFNIEEPLYQEIPEMPRRNTETESDMSDSDMRQLQKLMSQVRQLEIKKRVAYEQSCKAIKSTTDRMIKKVQQEAQGLLQEAEEQHAKELAIIKEVEHDVQNHLSHLRNVMYPRKISLSSLDRQESKERLSWDGYQGLALQLQKTFNQSKSVLHFVHFTDEVSTPKLGILQECFLSDELSEEPKSRAYSLPGRVLTNMANTVKKSPKKKPALPPRNPKQRLSLQEGQNHNLSLLFSVQLGRSLDSQLNLIGKGKLAVYSKPKILFKLTKHGSNIGEIDQPSDVSFLPNGDFLVAELGSCRIQQFNRHGRPVHVLPQYPVKPKGLCITQEGYIAVMDELEKNLKVFTRSGELVCKFGTGYFKDPSIINITPEDKYTMIDFPDTWNPQSFIYDPMSGTKKHLGYDKQGNYLLNHPEYITADKKNNVLVSDGGNNHIVVFDQNGGFLLKFGGPGDRPGDLSYPKGICTDQEGNIFVAESGNHRISMFNSNGEFVQQLLGRADGIYFPKIVKVSREGMMVVIQDSGILVYQMTELLSVHL